MFGIVFYNFEIFGGQEESVAHCKEAVAMLVGVDWNSTSQLFKSLADKRSQWHIAVGSSKHEA